MSRNVVLIVAACLFAIVGGLSLFTLPASAEATEKVRGKLDRIPLDLSPWVGADVPTTEVRTKHMKVAEADAYINRLYTNATTKQVVSVSILYGNQGAMCAHDPNTCYAGSGYAPASGRSPVEVGEDKLWRTRFEKPDADALDVCWGFGVGDKWKAPDYPRGEFWNRRMLYKMYVQRGIPTGPAPKTATDPIREFLTVFLPALKTALTAE